jgi:hypothetical protein
MKTCLRGAQGCAALLALLVLGSAAGELPAAPFVPGTDAMVLEILPRTLDAGLRPLRVASVQRPDALEPALSFARAAIAAGRASGDPRYFGQAEARLAPFTETSSPELHLLRALLREQRHDFNGALAELAAVLRIRPEDAQARFSRSVIFSVLGRYDEARADCTPLAGRVSKMIESACHAVPQSLSGGAAPAYAALAAALQAEPDAPASERSYALTVLAEIAERLGRVVEAERHYRAALVLESSPTLISAYSDFLLDQRRPTEVIALIGSGTPSVDALLLRLVLAERETDPVAAKHHAHELAERFAAAQQRGDFAHQREAAWFALVVDGDATHALRLARDNWAVQREARDARLLIEAAMAAGEPASARAVFDWLEARQIEDRRLDALRQRFEAGSLAGSPG